MRHALYTLSLLLSFSLISFAQAAPKKKQKTTASENTPAAASPLEADLGKLKWGMSIEEVKSAYYDRLEAIYKEKLKGVRDTYKADQILAQKKQEKKAFEDSYKKFDTASDVGRFGVSIVGQDIKAGFGESMLIIKDEKTQRFLFFADGKFYKLFVAYEEDYLGDLSFEDFVAKIAEKHGKPKKQHALEIKPGESQYFAAEWSDKTANLWVEDKRSLYGSVILVYTDPAGRQIDYAKLLTSPKDSSSKYGMSDDFIESLGRREDGTDPTPSKAETPAKTTKKDTKKDSKKKVPIDPLEGIDL